MTMFIRHSVALLMLFALSGCGLFENPLTCNPGPTSYQVSQAKRFDPYPDPTTGPPIVGGRPIDYMEPRPEPDVTKHPRMLLGSGIGSMPASAYPPAPLYVAPPAGATMAPVPTVPPTSYAPPARAPASAVVPATAMVPIPPATLPAAAPSASGIPAAYGTKIDGP